MNFGVLAGQKTAPRITRNTLCFRSSRMISEMSSAHLTDFTATLKSSALEDGLELDQRSLDGLSAYYQLLNTWNPRLHLVAPTSPAEFATRHVLESLTLLQYLHEHARVADVGSGGGLPMLPCLIVREDIRATLIESSKKKAIFLREVLTETQTTDRATVINDRFENVATPAVGYVTCRAIERFEQLVPQLIAWSPAGAKLLLFGGESLKTRLEDTGLTMETKLLPNSQKRFLFVVR